jgi:hypothetical protein
MVNQVVQKLVDKGFDGVDIHYFLQRFDIGMWIKEPYIHPVINVTAWDTQKDIDNKVAKVRKLEEEDYQRQLKIHSNKWELANIALDFEKHK